MRRGARNALALLAFAIFCASAWALSMNPFVAPYKMRTEAELRARVAVLLARIDATEIENHIIDALDAKDTERATALARFADQRGVALPSEITLRLEAQITDDSDMMTCLWCALNAENCASFTQVATCNLPAELTPVGDVTAVGRALGAYTQGEAIDKVDLSLALVGLAATGAIMVSFGTSASVKGGTAILRVARRSKALGPQLSDEVTLLANRSLRLERAGDVALHPRRWSQLIDTKAAGALVAVAGDAGRLTMQMPVSDALAVMRSAENAQDLAVLARVGDVAGAQTRGTIELLGVGRVLRAGKRLTEMAMATIALMTAMLGQIVTWFLIWLRRRLRTQGSETA